MREIKFYGVPESKHPCLLRNIGQGDAPIVEQIPAHRHLVAAMMVLFTVRASNAQSPISPENGCESRTPRMWRTASVLLERYLGLPNESLSAVRDKRARNPHQGLDSPICPAPI